MLVELSHETTFQYDTPVSEVYVETRLSPITDGCQHLLQHRYRVSPACPIRQYVDAFGNTVSYFNHNGAIDRLTVTFDSVVETFRSSYRGQGLGPDAIDSPAARVAVYDFLRHTPLTAPGPELDEFLKPLRGIRGASPLEAATALSEAIFGTFRYDKRVTNAASPITDLLRQGGGVCQDFAHLMLASARALGYPARYASGYLSPDLDGEAASHAWCELFEPACGWFGMDPTHNRRVEEGYVCLGIGRDYKDVAPNRGVYRGKAEENLTVKVTLRPINAIQLGARSRSLNIQPRASSRASRAPRRTPADAFSQQLLMVQHQQQQQQQQQ
jgi:transglutaminase-like putative cysteine protease